MAKIASFNNFSLSPRTLEELRQCGFVEPTEIQKEALGVALRGCDVLGAAKTGSGKTIDFIVPVLESLWRNKWTQLDGMGALIISPTRELSYQTYQVLCNVGKRHDFSAALIIGGTEVDYEKEWLSRTNIIVCTPGRLLQHMDENPYFSCDNLQILVLDEADRILDLGFKNQLTAVIDHLPKSRQTQTKSIKDLALLSLKDPKYISVHESASHATPDNLIQSYLVCDEPDKLNFLWSFLKGHLHSKSVVFLACCKQVRYVYLTFKRLQSGLTVLALHGAMPQAKRVKVYEEFCRKQSVVLFATDIAARGLDFPAVDWVVQLDCPSTINEYIHRSGRTARYRVKGEPLLLLTTRQKAAMLELLHERKVPIDEIEVNNRRWWNIQGRLESICAQDQEMKLFAQRAFGAYLRCIFLMSNKQIFKVEAIPIEEFARSSGLLAAPRVRFMKRQKKQKSSGVEEDNGGREDIADVRNRRFQLGVDSI